MLLETLIALVIFSFGLLGGLALLIESLRTSHEALQRTLAVALAADLAERIRANRQAGIAYELTADSILLAPDSVCDVATPCAAATRAALDLYEWRQRVADGLPGAVSHVAVAQAAASGTSLYTIEIRWSVPGQQAEDVFTLRLLA